MNTDDSGQEFPIGMVKFPLDKIERQDEYDLELEIPDENDEKIITAKINAKIRFIWSWYKYYQDLYTKSEKHLQNYTNTIQRTNNLLENLNEPLKYFEVVEDNEYQKEFSKKEKEIIFIKQLGSVMDHKKQYEVADKLENMIKNTFSNNFIR